MRELIDVTCEHFASSRDSQNVTKGGRNGDKHAAPVNRVAAFATPASGLAGKAKSLEKPEGLSRITGQLMGNENRFSNHGNAGVSISEVWIQITLSPTV
jgi:hypothetical protein